jgi:hypothetical protein
MSKTMFVRLQPVNPKQGCTVQGYSYREFSFRGGERPTWYEVPAQLAEELSKLFQIDGNPRSPTLFQVCDKDTKLRLERGEQEKYLAAIGAVAATVTLPKQFAEPPTVSLVEPPKTPPPISASTVKTDVPDRAAAIPSSRSGGRRAAKAERAATAERSDSGALTTSDIPSSDDE